MADDRIARRERRRRQLRRRRLIAAGALLCAALALAAVLLTGRGAGPAGTPHTTIAGAKRAHATATTVLQAGAPVRNATPQPDWRPYTGPVPILEYHVIGPAPPSAPYPDLYVSRPDFHRQMNWLDRHGYQAVTLDQVEAAWFHAGPLPPKPVVVSFDDGYRPQFTYALPELRRHGWAGVLNLKAEGSGLYPSNVRAMLRAGWELASHTIHHLDLTTLDAAQLKEEVAGSRAILRRQYGVPVDNFCYPSGRYDETAIAALKAAGYVGAMTEIPGYATRQKPYELARIEVLGSFGAQGLAGAMRSYAAA